MNKATTPISQVGKWGGIAAKSSFGIGVVMDGIGVYNYTLDATSSNSVHP
jgi:hypothetical protein